jgi:hypothetical protein
VATPAVDARDQRSKLTLIQSLNESPVISPYHRVEAYASNARSHIAIDFAGRRGSPPTERCRPSDPKRNPHAERSDRNASARYSQRKLAELHNADSSTVTVDH